MKPVAEMENKESCPKCGRIAKRDFVPHFICFTGTKVEHPEFNPGLGCIVRNSAHRKELCKERRLEEVGTEPPEKLHSHFAKVREEKREQAWADIDKGWVGDGSS